MSKIPEGKLESLALAIASGTMTINLWAKEHNIPERSAYRWAKRPWVQARVSAIRADLTSRAVGILVRHAGAAAASLAKIVAPSSTSRESDQISAARVLLGSLIDVSAFAELGARVAALEEASAMKGSKQR